MQYAIGDIHGMFNSLLKLLVTIEEQDKDPRYIFVGDYPDRGPRNKSVVDLMIKLKSQGHSMIRGNHCDIIDYILNGTCKSQLKELVYNPDDPASIAAWWMRHGLIQTFGSYGLETDHLSPSSSKKDCLAALTRFRDAVPEDHKRFYADLPLFWENDTHFVLHAYLTPDLIIPRFGLSSAMNKSSRVMDALWSRFPNSITYKSFETNWGKTGIFGHTPTINYGSPEPIKSGDIRLIDTGAIFGGLMTAYCLETDEFISVEAQPESGDHPIFS